MELRCFLFKQKTAYEMRISDWSSDVCSSDLGEAVEAQGERTAARFEVGQLDVVTGGAAFGDRHGRGPYRSRSRPACWPQSLRISSHLGDHVRAASNVPRTGCERGDGQLRSEEHTSELQSLMRTSYAVFCLKNTTYIESTIT